MPSQKDVRPIRGTGLLDPQALGGLMGGIQIEPGTGTLPVNREALPTVTALPTPMEGIQTQGSVGMLPVPASSQITPIGAPAGWFMGQVPTNYQATGEHLPRDREQQLLPPPPKKPKLDGDPGASFPSTSNTTLPPS